MLFFSDYMRFSFWVHFLLMLNGYCFVCVCVFAGWFLLCSTVLSGSSAATGLCSSVLYWCQLYCSSWWWFQRIGFCPCGQSLLFGFWLLKCLDFGLCFQIWSNVVIYDKFKTYQKSMCSLNNWIMKILIF